MNEQSFFYPPSGSARGHTVNLHGCLITIVDTDRSTDLRLDAFGTAYHFTPMEKKAAGLLVIGLTTPEIGEELGVATSTAQTHVKSVFHKTRSSNWVNFVWRAVQFSPQIS
ncbi:MAG: helix-turn-helix transcriptional regulator [Rhodobacteraceae bacterium]|nr:helix-turn-helix transcriptional regulator [Paracoccaceae bacterium]